MRTIDAGALLDGARFSAFHMRVLFWCALIIIFDGYDLVIYGVVLPALMKDWGLSALEAGLLGSWLLWFVLLRLHSFPTTLAGWKDLTPDGQKRLEACTSAIINKLLHTPTSLLKKTGQGGRTDLYVDALRQLFELEMAAPEEEELGELEE